MNETLCLCSSEIEQVNKQKNRGCWKYLDATYSVPTPSSTDPSFRVNCSVLLRCRWLKIIKQSCEANFETLPNFESELLLVVRLALAFDWLRVVGRFVDPTMRNGNASIKFANFEKPPQTRRKANLTKSRLSPEALTSGRISLGSNLQPLLWASIFCAFLFENHPTSRCRSCKAISMTL